MGVACLDRSAELEITDQNEDIHQQIYSTHNAAQAAAAIFDRMQAKRGLVKGRLRIGRDGTITVIRFNDRYLVEESEIALVNKELHENLNKPNLRVLLDCKNVRRLSTAAVTMIDELFTWLKPWGSSMAICRVRKELQGILSEMHLRTPFPLPRQKGGDGEQMVSAVLMGGAAKV